jgi:hypothetical protein
MPHNWKISVSRTQKQKHFGSFKKLFPAMAGLGLAFLLTTPQAHATASFSRQTGQPCNTCHTTFPELTPFGRAFKLNGYTLSAGEEVTDKGTKNNAALALLKVLPLSINLRGALTQTGNRQPDTQNSNIELPQQVNLWFAGRLAEHIGSYTQMTYNVQANHFGFDNSDFFRFARQSKLGKKDLTWGIDANNNPTFEDVWNSTPAYGFPWAAPDAVVSPAASTLIDGGLGGDVLGLGAYAMLSDHLYGDVSLYRTQHIGGPQPANGLGYTHNIKGAAPYWRFAYQGSKGANFLEVGTYGFFERSYPGTLTTTPAISGPTDSYTDSGLDLSYERSLRAGDLFVVHSTFIYEKQDLTATFQQGGAFRPDHDLKTFRLDAAYHFGNKYTITAGPFITTGTADSVLYPTAAITGSANNTPKNGGYIAQLAWWPVQNIETGVQYRGYETFNGAGSNYDGSGRNASGNNTTYAFIWLSF